MKRLIVIMGVAGSGKSSVAHSVAQSTGWPYVEADLFHPAANIEKMRKGQALDNADRHRWISDLRVAIGHLSDTTVLLACSALNQTVRTWLADGLDRSVSWCWLDVSETVARARVADRMDHFMPADLIASQFQALEAPGAAMRINADAPFEDVLAEVFQQLEHVPPRITDPNDSGLRKASL